MRFEVIQNNPDGTFDCETEIGDGFIRTFYGCWIKSFDKEMVDTIPTTNEIRFTYDYVKEENL